MDKTVRGLARAQTERGNTRDGATKKREISLTLLSINLHFSALSQKVAIRLRQLTLAAKGSQDAGSGNLVLIC